MYMEKSTIIISGLGLGALLLLFSRGSSAPQSSAATIAAASLQAGADQIAIAPALLNAQAQLEQVRLAASNAHSQDMYNFMSKIDTNNVTRQANFLTIGSQAMDNALANVMNQRQTKTDRVKIATDAQVRLAEIEAQKKMAEPDLGGQLLGFFDSQLGLAQMNAGNAFSGLTAQAGSVLSSIFSGGGAGSGSALSALGGGAGGQGSESGGGLDLSKIMPMVMAMFA